MSVHGVAEVGPAGVVPEAERSRRVLAAGMLLATELILGLAMWPVRNARFGIIDDHGIIDLLHGRQRIPLAEVLPTMGGHLTEPLGRFRPLFWVGWVGESALAGHHPTLWYLDRFVLAALTAAAVYWACIRFINPMAGSLVTLTVMFGPQFETWIRLGAAEAYAMPLFAWGCALMLRASVDGRSFGGLVPGLALLAGSAFAKENFLLPFGLALIVSVGLVGVSRMTRTDWLRWALLVAVALGDALMMVVHLARYGAQYTQVRNVDTVGDATWLSIESMLVYQGLAACLAVLLLLGRSGWWRDRTVQLWLVAAALFFGTQVLLYAGGDLPGRYLYPLTMLVSVAWVFAFRRLARGGGAVRTTAFGLAVVGLLPGLWVGFLYGHTQARANALTTSAFQRNLADIERVAHARQLHVIVVQPYEPLFEQERVAALAGYLHNEAGFTVMTLPATHPSSEFSRSLAVELDRWSREGNPSFGLAAYRRPTRCLAIVFHGQPPVCPVQAAPPG